MPKPHGPLVVSFLFAAALGCVTLRASAATRFVFTTFLGDDVSEEKLSVYTSSDGLNFTLLSNTNYGGTTGVLRDPSIMKHADGKYYIAYTIQSWTTSSDSFAIASSTDLKAWTFVTEVPAGVEGARFTWAPEWFLDSDGAHLIVNIAPPGDANFRSYDFKAKDATLTEWEPAVPIGIGPNNIDTFIVKDGATYHAFSKNETTKYIEHATAPALHGPWDWIGKNDWAGWGSGKEGIALFRLDNGDFRMFLDCYSGCGFLYADSKNLVEWSAAKSVPSLSGVRHGTVLREELGGSGGTGGTGGVSGAGAPNAGAPNAGGVAGGLGTGGLTASGGGGAVNAAGGGGASTAGGLGGASNGGSALGASGGRGPTGGANPGGGTTATGGNAQNTAGAGGSSGGRVAASGGSSGRASSGGDRSAGLGGGAGQGAAGIPNAEDSGCGYGAPSTHGRSRTLVPFALLLLAARRWRRAAVKSPEGAPRRFSE